MNLAKKQDNDVMNLAEKQDNGEGVLFVDLDGTLLGTDILCESLLLAVKRKPFSMLKIFRWAGQGRASLKRGLSEEIVPDASQLPYHAGVLEFIQKEHARGRTVVLATASDYTWAREVAEHIGLFDDVLASDGHTNLKGAEKLAAIQAYCCQHGYDEFSYIGNERADLPIWKRAAQVYAVEPTTSVLRSLKQLGKPLRILEHRRSRLAAAIRALRPQQWVKNLLVFLPVLLAQELENIDKLIATGLAFWAFTACASSVYIVNDLLDVEADRRHPVKRYRPFASGALPLAAGPPLASGLVLLGFLLSITSLPWSFVGIMALYLVLTTAYSLWLKREMMIDVLLLAGLYTLRIVAGGAASGVPVSEWLLGFSMFFFLSLAFAKRYVELARLAEEGQTNSEGRGYVVSDLSLIESLGPASGYLAVLVFALYINSEAMPQIYENFWALWLICPLLLYWISRIWFLAKRGELLEDPVVFASKDRLSFLVGVLTVALVVIAAY